MITRILKSLWIGLSLIVLFVTLYAFDGKPNSDIGNFLAGSMLCLSFPASYIFSLLYTGILIVLDKYFSIIMTTSYISLIADWLAFFILGYVQWFKLVPFIIKKYEQHQH